MIAGCYRSRILAAMQPRRAPHNVIQATTSEGLAQGPYVAASGMKSAIFRTEGTDHHQSATTLYKINSVY